MYVCVHGKGIQRVSSVLYRAGFGSSKGGQVKGIITPISKISKISLPKNVQPQPKKYCWAFTLRYINNNTKCYSKQYTGR